MQGASWRSCYAHILRGTGTFKVHITVKHSGQVTSHSIQPKEQTRYDCQVHSKSIKSRTSKWIQNVGKARMLSANNLLKGRLAYLTLRGALSHMIHSHVSTRSLQCTTFRDGLFSRIFVQPECSAVWVLVETSEESENNSTSLESMKAFSRPTQVISRTTRSDRKTPNVNVLKRRTLRVALLGEEKRISGANEPNQHCSSNQEALSTNYIACYTNYSGLPSSANLLPHNIPKTN